MKRTITGILFFFICLQGFAQESLINFDRMSNKPFIKDNTAYFFKDYKQVFKDEEALRLLKSAKSNLVGAQVLGGFGAGLLGGTLYNILTSKKNNLTEEQWNKTKSLRGIFLGSSAVFIGSGILVARSGLKKSQRAVDIENQLIQQNIDSRNVSFLIGGGLNNVALKMIF